MNLSDLIDEALSYHSAFYSNPIVVKPSLPILYFGDIDAYRKSQKRIITVAKNPSLYEFKEKEEDQYSFLRFPFWNPEEKNLEEALNNYFKFRPYETWFSSYEKVLNGFKCTYYPNSIFPSTALHTDVCSPIATAPTWSKLVRSDQDQLFQGGHRLWKLLIEVLQPDIMLVSIPKNLYKAYISDEGTKMLDFVNKKNNTARRSPYIVSQSKYTLSSGKKVLTIFGQAAQRPFDLLSDKQKREIGEALCPT